MGTMETHEIDITHCILKIRFIECIRRDSVYFDGKDCIRAELKISQRSREDKKTMARQEACRRAFGGG